MEQGKNSFAGPSKTSFPSIPEKEKSAWKLPNISNAYHASTDASLFSTSLPVLPHVKFNFNESEQVSLSIDDGFPTLTKVRIEDEVKDPLEDTQPNTEGNFLPGDEDELFAGLMDDFDLSGLPTQLEDLDDDFFGSGGGLEIESESHESLVNGISRLSTSDGLSGNTISHYGITNGVGSVSGEHPYGEHPSRTLFVRNINSNVEDSELKTLFEQYGDIRTLYTACKHRGFVMISYYDIRAARTAMRALQSKPLRRRKLDIHFSIPKDNPSDKDVNQGTLVVFNLDASVSNDDLRQIFGAYGEVKEIRETPHKRHHKFIEFYDVRAADAALKALNRSDIAGKRIKLEPSRPGGARRSLMQQLSQEQEQDEARAFLHQVGSPLADSPPGSWPNYGSPVEHNSLHGYSQTPTLGSLSPVGSNHLTGLASILPSHASNPVKIAPIGKDPGRMTHANQVVNTPSNTQGVFQNHYSIPDSNLNSSPGPVSPFDYSKPSSVGTLSGPQFLWGSPSIQSEHANSSAWSSSLKSRPFPSSGQGIGFPYASQRSSFLGSHHHVGSAPSGIPLERHLGFFPDSPETSYINQAAFGVTNFGRNSGNHAVNVGVPGAVNIGVAFAGNYTDSGSPSSRMMSMTRNGPIYYGNGSFGATNNDGMIDRGRSRRAESGSQMDNKKQYQLDLEKIVSGEDNRTTLMIKNIPNKYTSKMLLAAIDETHKGTYDFLYLPIDFKNKCNVGYAFINMVSPSHIISFYKAFNGKKWEKFNSEKVASLAYARIQGKIALVSHFQNSSLMNEDKRCRPIVFQSEGQGTGDLEPFPSGNLNIFIRQPDGTYAGDSLDSPKGDPDMF
ncbi:MEI2-like protein 5 [Perilla frutescens var. hirtella]|uniref:MEI2-like protein 5 n=1 Tax=Perilla frutescens var. hirtella TaxID=608512 RepID=A0AAD4PET2_PERFH|nr:MEI2-like protein 5 [Perilla frutescens var. hirtella]